MFTRLPRLTLLIFIVTMLSGCLGVISTTLYSKGPEFEANRAINFKLHANEASNVQRISQGQGNILTLYKLVNDQPDTRVNYIASADIEFDGVKQRNWWQWWITYYMGVRYHVTTKPLPPGKYQFTVNGYKHIFDNSSHPKDYYITIAAASLEPITHESLTYRPILRAGRVWLDRNLGASQACQGSNNRDCYGCLYQWSRAFKSANGAICPVGYRVPSKHELTRLLTSYPNANDALQDNQLSIPQQGSSSKILYSAANTCTSILSTDVSAVTEHMMASTSSATCGSGITAGVGFGFGGPPTSASASTPTNALSGSTISIANTGGYNGPICPSRNSTSAQYIIGENDYSTLWSSSKAAHGYHYIFFSSKTNGEHRRDQDGYFPIRCITDL